MCLDKLWPKERIDALKRASRREPIRAFKVVKKNGMYLEGPSQFGFKYKTGYRTNEVARQKARQKVLRYSSRYISSYISPKYELAFHVFATRHGALSFYDDLRYAESKLRVIPCLVWDIVAAGTQARRSVIVARKMILLTDY